MINCNKKPSVSIVVATFNAEMYIDRFMHGLLCQSNKDFEVVINDGGSTDKTLDLIDNYKHELKININSQRDSGIYDAWNMAIDRTCADWILFIGADDVFSSSDSMNKILSAINSNSEFNMIGFYGIVVDDSGNYIKKIGGDICGKTKKYMNLCHPGLLHRKDILIEKFNTNYKISADYDFLLKNINKIKYKIIDDVVVFVGGGGISRTMEFFAIREALIIQIKNKINNKLVCWIYFFVAISKMVIRRKFGSILLKLRMKSVAQSSQRLP